ncbi:MAG: hypothetical protein A4E67_02230 [Syntrophaceae bacterium PtaB.Bin038]|nr:MAG: hypothetical protein A4E67_02230 [Syntrophaceae bacterium PtaB.Bin038]
MLDRDTAAGGAAQLGRLEFLSAGNPSADVVDDRPQRGAHRDLHETHVVHVAGEGEDLRPLALLGADAGVPGPAAQDDLPDVGEGFHVVQDARLLPETGDGGEGGPRAGHAALALDGGHQRRLLAADEGARALVDLDVEVEARAEDVLPEQAHLARLGEGHVEAVDRQRVLGPAVDVSLLRADRLGGDHHALEHCVGVRLEDAAVHKGPGVALVGVAEHVLHVARGALRELPLEPRREPGAAAAAQARFEDLRDDLLGRHLREGLSHARVAVAGDVLLDVLGVDEAAVSQHPEILKREEGDLLHRGDTLFLARLLVEEPLDGASLDEVLLDELGDVLRLDAHVDDAFGVDDHDGPLRAEAVAPGLDDLDLLRDASPGDLVDEGLLDRDASGCTAARPPADQQMRAKYFHRLRSSPEMDSPSGGPGPPLPPSGRPRTPSRARRASGSPPPGRAA